MKRSQLPVFYCCLCLISVAPLAAQNHAQRYRAEIFSSTSVAKDLRYGEAVNLSTGKNEILYLDLYQPAGDTASSRPVMIWIHGGGFKNQKDKGDAFFVTLAKRFALRGYVTASIDYRIYGSITPDAVRQAYEDAKAAVRWFRANAKTYRLDTTRIAVGGKSAGAITSLMATYAEPLGNSGNPGRSSEVSACIEMAGLFDTAEMEKGEPPVLIIHGTKDNNVPFVSSTLIKNQAELLGIPYDYRPVQGGDHDLSDHMEELVQWSSDFLYKYVIQGAPTQVAANAHELPRAFELAQNYPNPFSASQALGLGREPATQIRYTLAVAGEATLQVFNALGQQVRTLAAGRHEAGVYTKEFNARGLPPGLYFYRLKTSAGVQVRKMILAR
jgi:acetyl esterase/lipase